MKNLELKIPPLIVALICAILIWVIDLIYGFERSSFLFLVISALVFIIGTIISILGVLEFRRLKTTVNPMVPEKSTSLVVRGVYKFTRNPMYVGFLLWLCSLGFFYSNPISLIPILIFYFYMNLYQIIPEERILEEKFGEEYLVYKSSVRRWL